EPFFFFDRQPPFRQLRRVSPQFAEVFIAKPRQVAGGPRPGSEVFPLAPVVDVVAALAPRFREVCDLILRVALARKVPLRPPVSRVSVAEYLFIERSPRRALLKRQLVERYMVSRSAPLQQGAPPVGEALIGQRR
ncbi:MAG: hypothetical protein ACLUEQ_05095, partial [Cloacibacillus evryensis]